VENGRRDGRPIRGTLGAESRAWRDNLSAVRKKKEKPGYKQPGFLVFKQR
jgi:hypothetical protein